jgi:polysaccharide pyruvyl transferase WcaK-like protein
VAQVRDEPSRLLCENLGLFVEVGHDLTFSVDAVASASALASMRDRFVATTTRPRLVVNLRSGDMARSFADAVSTYARVSALEVWGLAFSEEDEVLMRRFAREGYFPLLRVERATTLSEVLDVLRGVRAAAGMRLHFAILAAAAQVPLVVAPYDPKVEAFAADRQIPLWREGLLPQPLMPLPSSLSSDFLREEIDTLCRRMLA